VNTRLRDRLRLGVGVSVLLNMAAAAAIGQTAVKPEQSNVDGLLRSELSLGGYTTTLAYVPNLSAANRPAPGTDAARVRVARLETNGVLRVGPLDLGKPARATTRYDVWLNATDTGWVLQITDEAALNAAAPATIVGEIPLSKRRGPASANLVAALLPEKEDTARVVLRWGEDEASADVTFVAPPRAQRAEESRPANTTVNRKHDEDTSALSRARLLAQRNETALVLPAGHRLSISFQRTPTASERSAASAAQRPRGLGADGADFARLASTPNGAVVMLADAAVPRLRIESPLRFGSTLIATGNQVPGFPGSYGVWLKRVSAGWRLVLNHEPDAWGSQHNPKFDAAEIDVKHTEVAGAARPFAIALAPDGANRGRLLIVWGPHEWSTEFQY
jgi:hypothetical protein